MQKLAQKEALIIALNGLKTITSGANALFQTSCSFVICACPFGRGRQPRYKLCSFLCVKCYTYFKPYFVLSNAQCIMGQS